LSSCLILYLLQELHESYQAFNKIHLSPSRLEQQESPPQKVGVQGSVGVAQTQGTAQVHKSLSLSSRKVRMCMFIINTDLLSQTLSFASGAL
jgi:hypothetical protein